MVVYVQWRCPEGTECRTYLLVISIRFVECNLISRIIQGEVTGNWRKLHNKLFVLLTSYYAVDQIKDMRWARHVACMGERKST